MVLPFIKLVTSMNKSVLHDVLNILEIGRNRKQYLNSVPMCLHFFTTIVQYNECYFNKTITMITCTTNCMLLIFCKSSMICSSSGIFIINNGGNVLLIEFALAEGMPELLVFIVMNAISRVCIVFWYFIKNMISVITSKMLHVKAA